MKIIRLNQLPISTLDLSIEAGPFIAGNAKGAQDHVIGGSGKRSIASSPFAASSAV